MRRRLTLAGIALVALLAAVQLAAVMLHALGDDDAAGAGLAAVPALVRAPDRAARTVDAYAGAGAWVDVFDTGAAPGDAVVPPAAVDEMADAGVRTVFLQAARDDDGEGPPELADPGVLAQFLVRAH